jgi:hypothetical protein
MKKLIFIFFMNLLILPLCQAQFKANMTFNSMGQVRTFAVYSSAAGYRYEFNEQGQEGVIIVKKGSPEIIILMPQQKIAMKGSSDNPMSMGNDPVGTFEHFKTEGNLKEIGKETVNGIKCTKGELWNESGDEYGKVSQKMFTVWISDDYDFPVKIIYHIDGSGNSQMEIKDIEPWAPDAKSFSIPDGYQVMDMPKMIS